MEASIVLTYRCNAGCQMCNTWKHPSIPSEELEPSFLEKLPSLDFCNITGGEPFLRKDLEDIIRILKRKSRRIVISTNGALTDTIVQIMKNHRDLGIRVSLEGLSEVNDKLRDINSGFDKGMRTILRLHSLGIKDLGFGITVSDSNYGDLIELFRLAEIMKLEFATAVVHNSYYFHTDKNRISKVNEVISGFEVLINELLKSYRVKNWFRAYFNYGIIYHLRSSRRLLPCEAGKANFFVLPDGAVVSCNGSDMPWIMGNLREHDWDHIWNGKDARSIREKVRSCNKNCWMIGTASPAMKKYISKPVSWIIKNKIKSLTGKRICID